MDKIDLSKLSIKEITNIMLGHSPALLWKALELYALDVKNSTQRYSPLGKEGHERYWAGKAEAFSNVWEIARFGNVHAVSAETYNNINEIWCQDVYKIIGKHMGEE